jgi:hypothetical protein
MAKIGAKLPLKDKMNDWPLSTDRLRALNVRDVGGCRPTMRHSDVMV